MLIDVSSCTWPWWITAALFIFNNFILNTRVAETEQSTPGCPSLSFPFVHILCKHEAFIKTGKLTLAGSNSPKHRSYSHVSSPRVPFFQGPNRETTPHLVPPVLLTSNLWHSTVWFPDLDVLKNSGHFVECPLGAAWGAGTEYHRWVASTTNIYFSQF